MSHQHERRHGMLRGLESVKASSTFEGRFGRMFRTLPKADFPDDALSILAASMSAEHEDDPTPETANPRDDEENTGISAGYTY